MRIEFPDPPLFSHRVPVRITDLNYGNHLGHDTLVSLLHEARARFFRAHGMEEGDVDGLGIILTELEVIYKKQVLYGQDLDIALAAARIKSRGLDFYYRVTDAVSGDLHALARTTLLFFDYRTQRPAAMPDKFADLVNPG